MEEDQTLPFHLKSVNFRTQAGNITHLLYLFDLKTLVAACHQSVCQRTLRLQESSGERRGVGAGTCMAKISKHGKISNP
jgi:hypothetical protein